MVAYPSWLRSCAALFLAVVIAGLGSGCHHGGTGSSATVSGTIYYTRTQVDYANQTLGANLPGQYARGVLVRAFQLFNEVDATGTSHQTWHLAGWAITDNAGHYSINVSNDESYPTFVEVASVYQEITGHQASVKLVADPAGIRSTTPEPNRPIYVYREDVAGNVCNTSSTDPVVNPSGVAGITGSSVVNVGLGTTDTWAVTVPSWYLPTSSGSSTSSVSAPTAYLAVGSRPLGILDSVWNFEYYYGDPTPSAVAGGVFDLHYYPGVTDYLNSGASSRRSFVIYDPRTTPLAFDGTKYHYFGTLAAGPTTDDAWDQGVLIPMLARNNLFGTGLTALFPTGQSSLANLSPDLVVVDGLADAMAANYLLTPFLTDVTATTPFATRDIRVLPANPGLDSPATWAAAGWKVVIRANSIIDSSVYWPSINPSNALRYFRLIVPTIQQSTAYSGTVWVQSDISNPYTQIGRLYEGKTGSDNVDLAQLFSDPVVIPMLASCQILWGSGWTENSGWTPFAADWGTDPNSAAKPLSAYTVTLSMANAAEVENFQVSSQSATPNWVYPNCSTGEVAYARCDVSLDQVYQLTLSSPTSTPLPSGASIEVIVDNAIYPAYVFTTIGTSGNSYQFTLAGNPTDTSVPRRHFFRIRLLSPQTLQADPIEVAVNLTPVS